MAAAAAALVYIERELLKMVSAQARPASHRCAEAVLCELLGFLQGAVTARTNDHC